MNSEETIYFMALQSARGVGSILARKLIEHFEGPKNVLSGKRHHLSKLKGIGPRALQGLTDKGIFPRAERELEFIERNDLSTYCLADKDYPEWLRHCPDAPIVLYAKGDFNIEKRRVISIVGTRNMTSYGREFLGEFFRDLKKYDPVVISGLAYGVDTCAHKEALRHGLITIGILAHGLDRIYPAEHRAVASRMLKQGGLMTEFWSGSIPERGNFLKRNRIVAGISEATLVVESAKKGGALITADLAGSYHRDVLAVPGRYNDPFSEGCNQLIRSNKAAMVTSAEDLAYALNWTSGTNAVKTLPEERLKTISPDGRRVFEHLLSGPMHLDQLALNCGFSIKRIVPLLLQLEMKGAISSLPGKIYRIN